MKLSRDSLMRGVIYFIIIVMTVGIIICFHIENLRLAMWR